MNRQQHLHSSFVRDPGLWETAKGGICPPLMELIFPRNSGHQVKNFIEHAIIGYWSIHDLMIGRTVKHAFLHGK